MFIGFLLLLVRFQSLLSGCDRCEATPNRDEAGARMDIHQPGVDAYPATPPLVEVTVCLPLELPGIREYSSWSPCRGGAPKLSTIL
jgi:hypothetical protein